MTTEPDYTAEATKKANEVLDSTTAAAKDAADKLAESVEASVVRIRELNERVIKVSRESGQTALDAYQAALESVISVEQRLAEGTQLDWFKTLVTTQAEFTQRLGNLYLTTARDQLK